MCLYNFFFGRLDGLSLFFFFFTWGGLFVCQFWQQCIALESKSYFLKILTVADPPPQQTDVDFSCLAKLCDIVIMNLVLGELYFLAFICL